MAPEDEPEPGGTSADRLKAEAHGLVGALGDRAVAAVREMVQNTAGRLTQYVEGGAGPGLMAAANPDPGRRHGPGTRRMGGRDLALRDRGRGTAHSRMTRNHQVIRRWAEQRGGRPVSVKGTERHGEQAGILRFSFAGSPADHSFRDISWDAFFDKFESCGLAFVYQDQTARGRPSRFGKFISRQD